MKDTKNKWEASNEAKRIKLGILTKCFLKGTPYLKIKQFQLIKLIL